MTEQIIKPTVGRIVGPGQEYEPGRWYHVSLEVAE